MKYVKALIIFLVLLVVVGSIYFFMRSSRSANTSSNPSQFNQDILFINASQNVDGNTSQMGAELLEGLDYDQLNLVDYQVNLLGQDKDGDQFDDIITAMENAETIIIGTPVYWHSMSGALKTLIDRFYDLQGSEHSLEGKNLYFFMQGSAPTELSIESTEYIIERVASQTGMNLVGMADSDDDITNLHNRLVANQ